LRLAPPHWSRYFDACFLGVDEADWSRGGRRTAYGLLASVVDPGAAALGLYFTRPGPGLPFAARVAWKTGLALLVGGLAIGAAGATWRGVRAATTAGAVAAAGLASLLLPIALLGTDRAWQSGKAFSMVTPLLFVTLVLPLLARATFSWPLVPAAVLVGLHLGFGLARPVAAASPDGVHYRHPYPAVQDARLKAHPWDLERLPKLLAGCRDVAVSIEEPTLQAFTVLYLVETGVRWSPRRPLQPQDWRERATTAPTALWCPACRRRPASAIAWP
jgi:hypothetical protein